MIESLRAQILQSDVLASAALLALLFAIRFIAGRALKRREGLSPVVTRRWMASLRNLLILIAIVGLMMIWAPQLRTFALSLTAFAVASVIAMKELILCFSGSALRAFSRAYSVGDYIEIGGKRGEVMDFDLLVTRLREFEMRDGSFHHTGKEAIIPHSLLFSAPVRVEGHAGDGIRHVFSMTFEPDVNLFAHRAAIEAVAIETYESAAAAHPRPKQYSARAWRKPDDGAPVTISFSTSDIGKYRLEIAFDAVPEHADEAERAIACRIGEQVHDLRLAEKTAMQKPAG